MTVSEIETKARYFTFGVVVGAVAIIWAVWPIMRAYWEVLGQ